MRVAKINWHRSILAVLLAPILFLHKGLPHPSTTPSYQTHPPLCRLYVKLALRYPPSLLHYRHATTNRNILSTFYFPCPCYFIFCVFPCLSCSLARVVPSHVLFPRLCCSFSCVAPSSYYSFVCAVVSLKQLSLSRCFHARTALLLPLSLTQASLSLVPLSRSRRSPSSAALPLSLLSSSCYLLPRLFSCFCSSVGRATLPLVPLSYSRRTLAPAVLSFVELF